MKRKLILILVVAIVTVMSSACSSNRDRGATSSVQASPYTENIPTGGAIEVNKDYATAEVEESIAYDEKIMSKEVVDPAIAESQTSESEINEEGSGRKLVFTTNFDLQTKEFDKAIKDIESAIEQSKGYIQSSSISGTDMVYGTSGRYANYSLRVPTQGAGSFIKYLEDNFHVLSTSRYTEDITESYYDVDSQLKTLVEQEKRLNDLLEKGGDLEYIIQLERELSDVRYRINLVNNQLKGMDNRVNYDTVNVNIYEVLEYKEVEKIEDSFGVRIKRAFDNSWVNFVSGVEDFAIYIVYELPSIIIWAVILLVILFIVRHKLKNNKKNKIAKVTEVEENKTQIVEDKENNNKK